MFLISPREFEPNSIGDARAHEVIREQHEYIIGVAVIKRLQISLHHSLRCIGRVDCRLDAAGPRKSQRDEGKRPQCDRENR